MGEDILLVPANWTPLSEKWKVGIIVLEQMGKVEWKERQKGLDRLRLSPGYKQPENLCKTEQGRGSERGETC